MSLGDIMKRIMNRKEEQELQAKAYKLTGEARALIEESRRARRELQLALEEAERIIEKRGQY